MGRLWNVRWVGKQIIYGIIKWEGFGNVNKYKWEDYMERLGNDRWEGQGMLVMCKWEDYMGRLGNIRKDGNEGQMGRLGKVKLIFRSVPMQ